MFNVVYTHSVAACTAHFDVIASSALGALRAQSLDTECAWALCEYIDSVDAGDIAFDRAVYRQAVAALGEYLSHLQAHELQALMGKSWAAHTLGSLLQGDRDVCLPSLRAA